MATLKEAVESGRRWRFNSSRRHDGFASGWILPGVMDAEWSTTQAISSDFEIEPEPEKPREWMLHFMDHAGGSFDNHFHSLQAAPSCNYHDARIRVHDADACDRMQQEKQKMYERMIVDRR